MRKRFSRLTPSLTYNSAQAMPAAPAAPNGGARSLRSSVSDLERRMIQDALERHRWNKAKVARSLNIPRSTLYYRLRVLDLDGGPPGKVEC